MPLLGAHMSIAGGYFKAANAASTLRMSTVQIFTKNNNQWNGKPLSDEDIRLFRDAVSEGGLQSPCAHDSYLINLASPSDELWEKSLLAFIHELERAEALGLVGVVMHPGSFVTSSEDEGLERVIRGIDSALRSTAGCQVRTWVETTAGQGSNLGWRFEHLRRILGESKFPERLGVCVDTCHIFAAGYPLTTAEEYAETMGEFDRLIGLERIQAFHLNDSKKGLGSRVDRHEHIGEGCLGLEPFRHVVNDPRFAQLPMYMETPKGERDGEDLDAINLRTLRGLIGRVDPSEAAIKPLLKTSTSSVVPQEVVSAEKKSKKKAKATSDALESPSAKKPRKTPAEEGAETSASRPSGGKSKAARRKTS